MTDTSLAAIQSAVEAAIERHGLAADPATRLVDLVSEGGELGKAFVESTRYGRVPFARTSNWDEEIGDVAFALVALAAATGTPLQPAIDDALAKIDRRITETGTASSGRRAPTV